MQALQLFVDSTLVPRMYGYACFRVQTQPLLALVPIAEEPNALVIKVLVFACALKVSSEDACAMFIAPRRA